MRFGRIGLTIVAVVGLAAGLVTAPGESTSGLAPAPAFASTTTQYGVTFTTPDTRAACPREATTDTITATGVGGLRLVGGVSVQYVTATGRILVKTYSVDQIGDLSLTIEYPPVSAWPPNSATNPTREIHVDLSIELYYEGQKIYTFGPGQDWDLFCLDPDPSPTSTPTNTAVPPTSTPTNTPVPPTSTPTPGVALEGCTPGYWKQSQHFDSWVAYTPTQKFEAVFGRDVPGDPTLVQALDLGGGDLDALMRHTVAALLNASSPTVDPDPKFDTTGEVIAAFRAAFDSKTYEATKDAFARSNEAGCPLN
jgi:hypothetical protein